MVQKWVILSTINKRVSIQHISGNHLFRYGNKEFARNRGSKQLCTKKKEHKEWLRHISSKEIKDVT